MAHNPNFSSGPSSKRPGWNLDGLKGAAVGRSHRSALGKAKLGEAIARSKKLLGIPGDYLLGIMPGSDTGAFEAAMWTMLGPRPVTVLVWESFSGEWAKDIQKELKLKPTSSRPPTGSCPTSRPWTGRATSSSCQRHDQRRENPQLGLDPRRPRGALDV
jgi:phosphoserine aminotransferase